MFNLLQNDNKFIVNIHLSKQLNLLMFHPQQYKGIDQFVAFPVALNYIKWTTLLPCQKNQL